jgi:spore coat protein U-like protein
MNHRTLTALLASAAALAALVVVIAPARALTSPQTSSIAVTASVAKSCKLGGTTLPFGAYDPNAAVANDALATFTLDCTKTTVGTVSLNAGANGGRNMKGAIGTNTDLLKYELYSDSGRTSIWDATNTVQKTGPAQTLTVYGRIAPGLFVTPDSYSDTVTASVNF